jgi:acyl carrier protein
MDISKLKSIIASVLSIDESTISESSSFITDLNCDSLSQFQIIMAIEDELGIEFPTDEIEKIKTVSDALKLINDVKK